MKQRQHFIMLKDATYSEDLTVMHQIMFINIHNSETMGDRNREKTH